jgi:site-specific recombinase XerC
MASIYKRKGDRNFTIAWNDHNGDRRERSAGTSDKRLAERIAAGWEGREVCRREGLIDPAAERLAAERARTLAEHFADYRAHLDALQRNERHAGETARYLDRIAGALEWGTLASIDAHALTTYLAEQAEQRGTGPRTFNAALTAWRAFARWCVRTNRLASNPLASIRTRNVEADRRRIRRDLTTDELGRIIDAAERTPAPVVPRATRNAAGERVVGTVRMHYPERAWAYRIASGTGFRASEVASLTRESFNLDATPPTVTVEAAYSKRRRRDVQPMADTLAAMLAPWLASKPAGVPVCALPERKAALLLRADMDAARAAWIDAATDPAERAEREASDYLRHIDSQGRVVDFHGLRVHYVSRIVEAGATVRESMELARHSDPRLTMRVYAKVSMHNLAGVLSRMHTPTTPRPEREAMRATGTHGRDPPE